MPPANLGKRMGTEPAVVLLLDTHVWIWLIEGVAAQFGRKALRRIERASSDGRLRVSIISVWEVAMLASKGRVQCLPTVDEWVHRNLRAPGLQLSDLTPEIAVDSSRLPNLPHGDPADRLLIATARRLQATLVTRDRAMLRYARTGQLVALNAGR